MAMLCLAAWSQRFVEADSIRRDACSQQRLWVIPEKTPRHGQCASDAPGAFLFLGGGEDGWLSGKET